MLYHLQTRCSLRSVEFVKNLFGDEEIISDVEFVSQFKEGLEIWIDDQELLDILEDDMTFEIAYVFV
jgi:hypothetical protein